MQCDRHRQRSQRRRRRRRWRRRRRRRRCMRCIEEGRAHLVAGLARPEPSTHSRSSGQMTNSRSAAHRGSVSARVVRRCGRASATRLHRPPLQSPPPPAAVSSGLQRGCSHPDARQGRFRRCRGATSKQSVLIPLLRWPRPSPKPAPIPPPSPTQPCAHGRIGASSTVHGATSTTRTKVCFRFVVVISLPCVAQATRLPADLPNPISLGLRTHLEPYVPQGSRQCCLRTRRAADVGAAHAMGSRSQGG